MRTKIRDYMKTDRVRVLLARAYLRGDSTLSSERAYLYADYDLKKR